MTRFAALARFLAVAPLLLLAGCGAGIYPYSLDPKPPVPAPQITLSPTALTFSAVTGQTSAAQTVTVGNSGNATLNLASITLLDTTNYIITSNSCGSTLAPSANCSVAIAFAPQSVATLNSALHFVDNSNNVAGATQDVTLSGTGTAVPMPIAQLTPTSFAFPDTPTGLSSSSTSAPSETFTLQNIGTGALTLSPTAAVSGSSFALATNTTSTCIGLTSLAAGSSCTYVIVFAPTATGPQSGSLTVTDNSNNIPGSTQTSTFTGNGTAPMPIITITPMSLDFGSTTAVGQSSSSQTVTLGNSGNATLTFASIVLNSFSDYILVNNCSATLAPSATCTLVVSFTPSNPGAIPSSITLTDNDHNITGSTQTISLTGTGATPPAPIAQLMPLTYTFLDTPQSTTNATTETITLTNIGTAALTISGISYTGASFGESAKCLVGSVLPVGNSCTFTVSFTPTATGAQSGSVTVTDDSNGIPGSTQTATFSGNGLVGNGALTLTPTSATFPNTFAGNTSAPIPFTLTNNGSGTATGLAISFTGGTSSSAFAQTNNCGTSLASGLSCTINATFTPSQAGTYESYLTVNYTGATAPLQALVTGPALAGCTTGFSPTSITFNATSLNTAAPTQTATFTNCSSSALNLSSIVLTQSSTSNPYTMSNTCGTSLASAASCTFTINFTPTAAITYTGSVTVTDNATNSPQVLTLSGSGTTATISYQLLQFGFLHTDGVTPTTTANIQILYNLIINAKTSVDMVMYAMSDTTFTNYLVAACNRGVKVRAILDQNSEKSRDTPTYNALNAFPATQCSAVWANKAFAVTHEKSLVIDNTLAVVMSLNLESQYYATTRDWAMIYNDPADVAAMEATYNMDFAAGTPASGVAGASDFSYQPGAGSGDLIWSPTTAQTNMLKIINNATATLVVSNEELGTSVTSTIVAAMVNACKRGVVAHILIENSSSYASNFAALSAAGCGIHSYNGTGASDPYIHAKAVVADYGLPTQNAYMGSINYSSASMNQNRELGMFISDQASVTLLYNSILDDYNGPLAVAH